MIGHYGGGTQPGGALALRVIPAVPTMVGADVSVWALLRRFAPWVGQDPRVFAWRLRNFPRAFSGWARLAFWRIFRAVVRPPGAWAESALHLRVTRADGEVIDYGVASFRVVTDAGVAAIVDAFTNTFELENLNFHGIGTGTTAEAQTQTALVTELTTQYNPDNTRATGTQSQPSANVYRTVGTNAVDAAVAITEHGIFSQAATGGGTMLDRSVFAAINLGSGDSLQSTYDFTVTAGG